MVADRTGSCFTDISTVLQLVDLLPISSLPTGTDIRAADSRYSASRQTFCQVAARYQQLVDIKSLKETIFETDICTLLADKKSVLKKGAFVVFNLVLVCLCKQVFR